MPSLKQHAGFLEIDHRESPGLTPADVAHVPGSIPVAGGSLLERDVQMCSHCQRGVVLEPLRTRDRGYCPKCNHFVCDSCETIRVKTGECVPFVKVLDVAHNHAEKFVGREDSPEATPKIILTDGAKV